MVWTRPFLIGKPGWVRSRACVRLFSSTDKTSACSGGFRYRPTIASNFSGEMRIVADLEALGAVRLQSMPTPDSSYAGAGNAHLTRHPAARPMRGVGRLALCRLLDDLSHHP